MIVKNSLFVVVLNYNNYIDTFKCIESLQKCDSEINIIVVDNSSTNDSRERISRKYTNLKCIQTQYNGGYAYGMNYGIKYAIEKGADYILLLNNDTKIEPDSLQKLVERAQSDESIGVVSPKVLYMHNNNIIYSAGGEFKKWNCVGKGKYRNKNTEYYGNEDREIDFAEGSCLLVKREVFERVGLIDEHYFMYFEDLDFSLKVNKYFKIVYCANSIIYHRAGGGTNWSNYSSLYNYYFTRNRLLFYKNFNVLWQSYSIVYSLVVIILKSITILTRTGDQTFQQKMKLILKLYKGFVDGLTLKRKKQY